MAKSLPTRTPNKKGLSELKQRLLFVLMGLIIFRIGVHIPVPGLDPVKLANFFRQQGGLLGWFNMFTGGALSRFSIFAVGIMPYISASIIVQLFSVVSPKLAALKKEGESGKRKLNQYTRYGTLLLALVQSFGLVRGFAYNIALQPGLPFYFTATVTLTTGTMFLMWLGEQITERGVGNGISLIIFSGIVSRMPSGIAQVFQQTREGTLSMITLIIFIGFVILVTGFVVFMERGQRRITVNYAQRIQGRRGYSAQSSHLPFKINMSGVIPPIFATSIILVPTSIASFMGQAKGWDWLTLVAQKLTMGHPLHMLIYGIAIVFFAFFYTALIYNPKETADNLKKSGAYLPGIRPGEQTAKYIDNVMTRLTLIGAIYLVFVCLLPEILFFYWQIPFLFGGTSLLITVVVLMDFMAQIQAHIMSNQYESLMKKANLKSGGSPLSGMNLL